MTHGSFLVCVHLDATSLLTSRSGQARDHLKIRQEYGQDDEEHDAAQNNDQKGLDQVAQVLDHSRNLFLVVVGQVVQAFGDLARFLTGLENGQDVGGKLAGRRAARRSAPCPGSLFPWSLERLD